MFFYKMGAATISSLPSYLKVETTDYCNLKCPHCHDGSVVRKNKFLDFSLYKGLIDQLKEYLFEVSLYDQGEPLLDPSILDYIKYANRFNIGTVISTNFSMQLSQDKLIGLVSSGLDYLIVAIDGVTQETYAKYRVGGNLDVVLSNLKRIIEIKDKLNSKTPFIEWQMIDFNFNKSEQNEAQILSKEIGVNDFILKPSTQLQKKSYIRRHRCPLLWFSLTVECDGLVSACFSEDDSSLYIGDINKDSIIDIWHSEKYKRIRNLHFRNEDTNNYFCGHCNEYDR